MKRAYEKDTIGSISTICALLFFCSVLSLSNCTEFSGMSHRTTKDAGRSDVSVWKESIGDETVREDSTGPNSEHREIIEQRTEYPSDTTQDIEPIKDASVSEEILWNDGSHVESHSGEGKTENSMTDGSTFGKECKPGQTQCKSNICHPSRNYCTQTCSTDSECISGKCERVTLSDGSKLSLCYVSDNQCYSDQGCPMSLICSVVYLSNPLRMGTRCRVPIVERPFSACSDHNDCQRQVCVENSCSYLCRSDADCPKGTCKRIEYKLAGTSYYFKVCHQ